MTLFSLIHRYDGWLSMNQVQRFLGYGTERNARRRVEILEAAGYLKRFKVYPGFVVVCLAKEAAKDLAEYYEIDLKEFKWRNVPRRRDQATHDILLNEFRHTVEVAGTHHPTFSLEWWYGQDDVVRTFPQKTTYIAQDGARKSYVVRPDGLFSLHSTTPSPHRIRFCVELDNFTEDNARFGRNKVAPGIQFVYSEQFRTAIGAKAPARFLAVLTGPQRRFDNMRAAVTSAGGAAYFFFAHFDGITPQNVLTTPIWHCAHVDRTFSLEEFDTDTFQHFLTDTTRSFPTVKLL